MQRKRAAPLQPPPTTPKGDLVKAPPLMYLDDPEVLLVVFDLSVPGGADALARHLAAWSDRCDVEVLDECRRALVIRPGWVPERAA